MELFTLCDCNKITYSYLAHKQKQIAVAIRKNAGCEWTLNGYPDGKKERYINKLKKNIRRTKSEMILELRKVVGLGV